MPCPCDGAAGGIWRFQDGAPWTRINPDTSAGFPFVFDRFVIGINPNNENEVYFLGSTPGYGHFNEYINSIDWTSLWKYTYISGDGSGAGGQWQNLSENLPNIGTEFDRFAAQGGYDLVVKVTGVPDPSTGYVSDSVDVQVTSRFNRGGDDLSVNSRRLEQRFTYRAAQ